MEQSLFQHLPKLVRANTQESIELILRSLWRTRKSGLDAAEKAHLQDLLQLPSHEELDPIVVCLRMLIRRSVHENLGEEELQKLFPPEFPLELQSLLVLLLKKLQIEWREDMAKDQLEWPRTRVVYQVKVGPTVPQTSPANMIPPIWPRLEDNRRPFNRCELGVPLGMPSGNLNSSRLVPQQPPQDDINGDSSLVSLPRLKAMTWSMENQNSTPANRVAVINLKVALETILMKLFLCSDHGGLSDKLQDYTKPSSGETEIKFQLSRDTLEAMLRSMYYIRDQLSNAAAAPSGPVLKKPRQ